MDAQTTPSSVSNTQSEEAAKAATEPFNLSSADVVFVTSDDVEYRLHKIILSIASPFFGDMFCLTQPVQSSTDVTAVDEQIPVTEESEIFGGLMRLLYPVADPPLTERLRVEQMLEASLKYQLQEATDVLRTALRDFIPQLPLQVFATACRLRLKEEAQLAAKEWKSQSLWSKDIKERDFARTVEGMSYVEEMAYISAGSFSRLLQYLRDTSSEPPELIDPPSSRSLFGCTTELERFVERQKSTMPTDITFRCRDGVHVPTYELIVRLALANKLLISPVPSSPETKVYEVDVESKVLRTFFQFCNPLPTGVNLENTQHQLEAIMALAEKYDIKMMVRFVRQHFHTLAPTARYLLAKKWGWEGEVKSAVLAIPLVVGHVHECTYSPLMEDSHAVIYFDMLKDVFARYLTWIGFGGGGWLRSTLPAK